MKRVRSRARDSVDDPAGGPAVIRRIVTSQNGNLLNLIDTEVVTQNTSRRSVRVVVDAHAIETITILIRPRAGNTQGCSKTALRIASALGGSGLHASDTRLKRGELGPIAAVERSINHRRGTDVSADGRRTLTGHRNSRPNCAGGVSCLPHQIQEQTGSHVHRDA